MLVVSVSVDMQWLWVMVKVVMDNILIPLHSGPPSCLCSKTEQCEITGENEVNVVPNISEVKFSFNIY